MTAPDPIRAALERLVELQNFEGPAAALIDARNDALAAARAALAAASPDGPAVPQGREPAAVTGQPSDEEIMELMPQQMRDDLAAAARALAGFDPDNIRVASAFRIILNRHCVDHANAVLDRWGK